LKHPRTWPTALVHEDLRGPSWVPTGHSARYYLIGVRYGYDEFGRFARILMADSALKRFTTNVYMRDLFCPYFVEQPEWLDELFDVLRLGQEVPPRADGGRDDH